MSKKLDSRLKFIQAKELWLGVVIGDKRLSHLPHRLAVAFFLYCNGDHFSKTGELVSWPSQNRLAEEVNASRFGLQRAIQKLVERGYLKLVKGNIGRANTNHFRLLIPKLKRGIKLPENANSIVGVLERKKTPTIVNKNANQLVAENANPRVGMKRLEALEASAGSRSAAPGGADAPLSRAQKKEAEMTKKSKPAPDNHKLTPDELDDFAGEDYSEIKSELTSEQRQQLKRHKKNERDLFDAICSDQKISALCAKAAKLKRFKLTDEERDEETGELVTVDVRDDLPSVPKAARTTWAVILVAFFGATPDGASSDDDGDDDDERKRPAQRSLARHVRRGARDRLGDDADDNDKVLSWLRKRLRGRLK